MHLTPYNKDNEMTKKWCAVTVVVSLYMTMCMENASTMYRSSFSSSLNT